MISIPPEDWLEDEDSGVCPVDGLVVGLGPTHKTIHRNWHIYLERELAQAFREPDPRLFSQRER